MIVDFHTHIFPEEIAARAVEKLRRASGTVPFSDGTEAGLRRGMTRAGIGWSVTLPVATNPAKVSAMNDQMIRLDRGDGLIRFGCMHPDAADPRRALARIAEAGIKGIKLHPVYQGADLDDPRYLRILDRAGELGLVVVTHAGDDIGFPGAVRCSPEMIGHALRQVGPVKLVAAHMGGWRCWERAEELLPGLGIWIDTSFSLGRLTPAEEGRFAPGELAMLDGAAFARLTRAFGADRVLFGTDSPWSDPAESVRMILEARLSGEEKADILGRNAARLLGIPWEEETKGKGE